MSVSHPFSYPLLAGWLDPTRVRDGTLRIGDAPLKTKEELRNNLTILRCDGMG